MNKKIITGFALTLLLVLPLIAFGDIAIPPPPSGGLSVEKVINGILNFIWPIFGVFAVVMFIFAGFLYLTAHGEPGKIQAAHKAVLWGIVGVAVALLSSTIPYIVNFILFQE